MKALILAGGIGRRMRPLTYVLPKCMLPIGEKPILEHILEWLKKNGIHEFVIATAYLTKYIEDYFEDGARWNVKIEYARGGRALGTGGQMKTGERFINDTFITMNGDVLVNVKIADLLEFHREKHRIGSVVVRTYSIPLKYGILELAPDQSVLSFREKPVMSYLMSTGLYVFEPEVFKFVQPGSVASIETDILPKLAEKKSLCAYVTETDYIDIEDIESLEQANKKFLERFEFSQPTGL